eukprot:gene94-2347_t
MASGNGHLDAITDAAIERVQNDDPRQRRLLRSLIEHMHAFVKDVRPTEGEWIASMGMLRAAGRKCEERGNASEFVLLSDVLGVSALLEAVNDQAPTDATSKAVLGPFHVANAPVLPHGTDIAQGAATRPGQGPGHPPAEPLYLSGRVLGLGGRPLAGAVVDLWHSDEAGLYDVQGPDVHASTGLAWGDHGMEDSTCQFRGKFTTNTDGCFHLRTIRPTHYPIPTDGLAGMMLASMSHHPYRPSHIHAIVTAPGHAPLVTQLYASDCPYVANDVVMAVKEDLVLDFIRVCDAAE